VLARYRSIRRIAWERAAGALAALVAALLLNGLSAVALLAIVVVILTLAVGVESVRLREVSDRL
jgi:hypothetical protein